MNAAENIIQQVPDPFSRKDILNAAKELGYSYSTANTIVEKIIYMDLAVRVRPGFYEKLEEEEI